MKKNKALFIVSVLFLFLAACSQNEEDNNANDENLDDVIPELTVDFDIPEQVEKGETIDLTAHVTYDGVPVEDADEVLFEVWTQGNSDQSVELEGKHQENGTYTASFTFEEEEVYEMYAHTTAEAIHSMPFKTVIVGSATPSEEDEHDEMDHEHHQEGHESKNHDDHE
ncbi:FixH family protein [Oceanobacillus sp. 1P07AA]|uniref:FixH family protein n=1 Tax=Oceanobacillus sp. 1P07AA TaxID=3132293 RepID=UPI0039A637D1